MSKESLLREEIVEIGRSLYGRGLSPGSSGNISMRLDDGWLLTPTNACLGRLDPADIAKLDWQAITWPANRPPRKPSCTARYTRGETIRAPSCTCTAPIRRRCPVSIAWMRVPACRR